MCASQPSVDGRQSSTKAKLGIRYQMFDPLPPPTSFGQPKLGGVMIGGCELLGSPSPFFVRHRRSNCGIRTTSPSYVRTASSTDMLHWPPPPFVLPAWP